MTSEITWNSFLLFVFFLSIVLLFFYSGMAQSESTNQVERKTMKTNLMIRIALISIVAIFSTALRGAAEEQHPNIQCKDLPTHAQLHAALKSVVDVGGTNNAGFGLNMWATIVNRDGEVCGVAFSGQ